MFSFDVKNIIIAAYINYIGIFLSCTIEYNYNTMRITIIVIEHNIS